MKKEKKIKYSGLSKLYILIGFVLILILWNIGFYISWCSGICIGFDIRYYWTGAGYISTFFFIVWIYLLIKGIKIKKEEQKQKNARLILSTGILSIVIFYIFSPNSYYFTPNFLQNRNWDLSFSIDKYIKNIEKYCFSYYDHGLPPKYEWGICEGKGKLDLMADGNIDYNIEIYKYSKKNKLWLLYIRNGRWISNKNLLEILKKYKDKDIYIYSIMRRKEDLEFLKLVRKIVNDKETLELIDYIYNGIIECKKISDNKLPMVKERCVGKIKNQAMNKLEKMESLNENIISISKNKSEFWSNYQKEIKEKLN